MEVYRLIIFFFILLTGCGPGTDSVTLNRAEETLHYISSIGSSSLRRSREASVKIVSFDSQGNKVTGSGAYVRLRGKHFIITAAHVVEGSKKALIVHGDEEVIAKVVYTSSASDISILKLQGLFTRKPLIWSTSKPPVGEATVYTGFPNNHDSLSIRGTVSGVTDEYIILHSYAWSGASGSVVLSSRGRMIGVVSALDVGVGIVGMPQIVEDIVLVAPISLVPVQDILESLE